MPVGSSRDFVPLIPVTGMPSSGMTSQSTSNLKEHEESDSDPDLSMGPAHHAPRGMISKIQAKKKPPSETKESLRALRADDDDHIKILSLRADVRKLQDDIKQIECSLFDLHQLRNDIRQMEYTLAVVEREAATQRPTSVVFWDLFPTLNLRILLTPSWFFALKFDGYFDSFGHDAASRAKNFFASTLDAIFLARVLFYAAIQALTLTVRTVFVKCYNSLLFNMTLTLCIIFVLISIVFWEAYRDKTLQLFLSSSQRNDRSMGFSWGWQRAAK